MHLNTPNVFYEPPSRSGAGSQVHVTFHRTKTGGTIILLILLKLQILSLIKGFLCNEYKLIASWREKLFEKYEQTKKKVT